MKALIGLGNPGPEYVFTRHNAGFLFLDFLCSEKMCESWKDEGYYLSSVVFLEDEISLFKPTTYMNLSGIAVEKILKSRGMKPYDVLIVYDDVSLPLGRIRIRKSGSDGGHNGVRSIINAVGTQDFPRLRIGIGPKPEGMKLADYVLSEFDDDELKILYKVFEFVLEAIEVIIKDGIDKAMSLYNSVEVVR